MAGGWGIQIEALFLSALIAGCTSDPVASSPTCTSTCGSGLTCESSQTQHVCYETPSSGQLPKQEHDDAGLGCTYDPGFPSSSDALLSGFGVAEMDSTYAADHPGELQFTPPDGARRLVCAVFSCSPDIQLRSFNGEEAVSTVMNFANCAVSAQELPASRRNFTLTDSSIHPCVGCAAATLDTIQVGCWAYDARHVIAATRLRVVDPRATLLSNQIVDCATSKQSGQSACTVPNSFRLGTCDQAVCRPHCQTAQDCEVQLAGPSSPDARDGSADSSDAMAFTTSCSYYCHALDSRNDLGFCKSVASP